MQALNFSDPRTEPLARLTEVEWDQALRFCDRGHLTTALARRRQGWLPEKITQRFASNLANNATRLARFERNYSEIAESFDCAGIEWVVLKGFSHWPGIGEATRDRPQYDLDLYCPPEHIGAAKDALYELGYRSLAGFDHMALDHIPTMVRPSNWKWRDDFFDVEIPGFVDLHYRLWDAGTERVDVNGVEQFWNRREWGGRPGFQFPAFSPPDLAGYAALHLLRHLLRGDLQPFHVYDIAWFLNSRSFDDELWRQWRDNHDQSLRRLELVVFQLARTWFECRLPPVIQAGISELPGPVQRWFELYAGSPLEAEFHPNKRELWLHLSLLNDSKDRRAVFLRRVLPARLPSPAEAQVEASQLNARRYWRKFTDRGVYHLRVLLPACIQGVVWWWTSRGFSAGFRQRMCCRPR
jgi:hypothetical protein